MNLSGAPIKYSTFVLIVISSLLHSATINVPADHSSIQDGLDAATGGDTVLVQPGTYVENIVWPDVNGIKLISAGDASNTIIDGDSVDNVILIASGSATIDSTTVIQGFKITNGVTFGSGGGLFIYSASPVLTSLWVTGNTASHGGGIVIIGDSNPILTQVTISGNTAEDGGGMLILGGSPAL